MSGAGLSRRAVLRAGGGAVAVAALGAAFPGAAAGRPLAAPALTTRNPLIERRADPFITRPVDGMYYFTGSVPEYDRIVVRGAPTIDGLSGAREQVIWRRPPSGTMGGHIWAPELHRIDGRWYIYFAAGDADAKFRIRMYVLESSARDPRADAWVLRGRITTAWDTFSLDATTFEHAGARYLCGHRVSRGSTPTATSTSRGWPPRWRSPATRCGSPCPPSRGKSRGSGSTRARPR
nr:family 43 glycosylhydrolase [Amycolatopsis suaedae]